MKYEEMSNNQLQTECKSIQAEHEAIKLRIVKELDNLAEAEKNAQKVANVLNERGFNIKLFINE